MPSGKCDTARNTMSMQVSSHVGSRILAQAWACSGPRSTLSDFPWPGRPPYTRGNGATRFRIPRRERRHGGMCGQLHQPVCLIWWQCRRAINVSRGTKPYKADVGSNSSRHSLDALCTSLHWIWEVEVRDPASLQPAVLRIPLQVLEVLGWPRMGALVALVPVHTTNIVDPFALRRGLHPVHKTSHFLFTVSYRTLSLPH